MNESPPVTTRDAEACEPAASMHRAHNGKAFLCAVQFLTRIPIPIEHQPESLATLARSPVFFPLVGGMIGLLTSIVILGASTLWPVWLAVVIALAAEALLTGALHEDAVADFCDAFGGGWTRDDVLRILKDSRVGAYGVLGLVFAVTLRGTAAIQIIQLCGLQNWRAWGAAIVAASAIGRWMMLPAMLSVPPIPSRSSLSRDIGSRLTLLNVLAAGALALPAVLPFAILTPLQATSSALALTVAFVWFSTFVQKRLGGMTGDCLGSLCYLSQVLVLLMACARWPS